VAKIRACHRFGKGGITCWHWIANSKGKQETFLFYLKQRVAPSQKVKLGSKILLCYLLIALYYLLNVSVL